MNYIDLIIVIVGLLALTTVIWFDLKRDEEKFDDKYGGIRFSLFGNVKVPQELAEAGYKIDDNVIRRGPDGDLFLYTRGYGARGGDPKDLGVIMYYEFENTRFNVQMGFLSVIGYIGDAQDWFDLPKYRRFLRICDIISNDREEKVNNEPAA